MPYPLVEDAAFLRLQKHIRKPARWSTVQKRLLPLEKLWPASFTRRRVRFGICQRLTLPLGVIGRSLCCTLRDHLQP